MVLPDAFQLRLEPDRLFSHFVGKPADSPSVTYLEHTGNTNPAAPVAELAQKPDLGMVVTPKTVSFTVIAALQSFSRQLADDFGTWMNFVPMELTRAIYDAETDFILNDSATGLLHTSGTLSRAVGSDSPIDAVVKSFNDIRVGSSFGVADLCVMSPSTFTFLRTQKNTLGSYLLAPNDPNSLGDVQDIFGVEVITNTKVPQGTVISLDSRIAVLAWARRGLELMFNQVGDYEFQHNALTYRAEERIAIGVQRPSAICVVTGVGPAGGS